MQQIDVVWNAGWRTDDPACMSEPELVATLQRCWEAMPVDDAPAYMERVSELRHNLDIVRFLKEGGRGRAVFGIHYIRGNGRLAWEPQHKENTECA